MEREVGDPMRLWERYLVMPMKKVGAVPGERVAVVERRRPNAPYVSLICESFFIHESKRAGKEFGDGNTLLRQMF